MDKLYIEARLMALRNQRGQTQKKLDDLQVELLKVQQLLNGIDGAIAERQYDLVQAEQAEAKQNAATNTDPDPAPAS